MIPEKDILLIESYLKDELSSKESNDFLKRIELEPELKKALGEEKELLSQLYLEDFDFVENLIEVIDEGKSKRTFLSKSLIWFITVFVALVFTAFILFNSIKQQKTDHSKLFAQNFEPYPMILATRGNGNDDVLNFVNAYNHQEWENAFSLIEEYDFEDMPLELNHVYRAVILLGLDLPEKSLFYLTTHKNNDGLYKETFLWYSALAYLKQEQYENCKQSLNKLLKITSPTSDRHKKALMLKSDLSL